MQPSTKELCLHHQPHKTRSFQDHPPLPKEKCFEKLRGPKVILSNGIDRCQARQPQGLASDQGSAFAEPWPSVITRFGKTYSPPEGTVFRQDSLKRESKQQVSTLSRKSSPSERTVFERPTWKRVHSQHSKPCFGSMDQRSPQPLEGRREVTTIRGQSQSMHFELPTSNSVNEDNWERKWFEPRAWIKKKWGAV